MEGLGDTQTFEVIDQLSADSSKVWGRLLSVNGNSVSFHLDRDTYTLGRSSTRCDLVFAHEGVSGQHCRLWRESIDAVNHHYLAWVQDTSLNGTYVNNERLKNGERRILQSGDHVDLLINPKNMQGNLSFVFHIKEEKLQVSVVDNKYFVGQELGKGSFSVVKLGIHKESGRRVALKMIEKKTQLARPSGDTCQAASRRKGATYEDEVAVLKRIRHENIIAVEEIIETDSMLYLVLELVTGGELFHRIVLHASGHCTEPEAKVYCRQILLAVRYLHGEGIVHRDLKPENILLVSPSSQSIKLTDFGLSRVIDSTAFLHTICGTPQYVAPEVMVATYDKGYDGKACDMWSFGVILYLMLCGYLPFIETESSTLYQQIQTAAFTFPDGAWGSVSAEAKELVTQCLCVDPTNRISADNALVSPWLHSEYSIVIQDSCEGASFSTSDSLTEAGSKFKKTRTNESNSEISSTVSESSDNISKSSESVLKTNNSPPMVANNPVHNFETLKPLLPRPKRKRDDTAEIDDMKLC